jgi:flavorubredoxin
MINVDYDHAVAVTREIYWVGFEEKESHLHCNPYLLLDKDEVVFFDPGSIPDFPTIMRKVLDVINPQAISLVVASHQDPDVCGNIAVVEDVIANPDLKFAVHSNTGRLTEHYGINSEEYIVDRNDFKFTLKSGRELEFIYAPYCHSPGAIVTYDKKSRSLFSGDLFGGVSKEWSLFAEDDYLEPMKTFHQLYMPSNQIVSNFMKKLDKYDIDRILPQHGSIIEGDDVQKAIDFLKELPCGVDLY